MVIPPPEGSGGAAGIIDPDGSRVAVMGYETNIAQLWEVGATEPTWERRLTDDGTARFPPFSHFWFSDDGEHIYVPLAYLGLSTEPSSPAVGLYTLDAETGVTVDFLPFPCLVRAMPAGTQSVRPGAPFVFDWWGVSEAGRCQEQGAGTGVIDIETGEILFETPFGGFTPPTLSRDGRVLGASGWYSDSGDVPPMALVFDTNTDEIIFEYSGGKAVVSGDGTRVLVGNDPAYLYDLVSGERLQTYQGAFSRIWFTPDEGRVVGVGPAGVIQIFDTESGTEVMRLRGHTSQIRTTSVTVGGDVLVSSGFDAARVWDISPSARGDGSTALQSVEENHFYPDALSASDEFLLVHRGIINTTAGTPIPEPHRIDVLRSEDGVLLWSDEVFSAKLGPGGLMFVQQVLAVDVTSPADVKGAARIGRPMLVDAATGQHVRDLEGCDHYWIPGDFPEPGDDCGDEPSLDYTTLEFSADGSTLLGATSLGAMTVWDIETGEAIRETEAVREFPNARFNQGVRWAAGLSPDGSTLVIPPSEDDWNTFNVSGVKPVMTLQDVVTGAEVGRFEIDRWVNFTVFEARSGKLLVAGDSLLLVDPESWTFSSLTSSQGARIDALAVSPDGRLAATIGPDEFVTVWDIERQRLVAEIPVAGDTGEGLRGVAFLDDETLVVVPEAGRQLLRFTLNPDTLFDLALDSLNRGFRPDECTTFDIDPCPTLEEMKAGS
jgi:WD40 repeat protein